VPLLLFEPTKRSCRYMGVTFFSKIIWGEKKRDIVFTYF
jgi:hypothetical protein